MPRIRVHGVKKTKQGLAITRFERRVRLLREGYDGPVSQHFRVQSSALLSLLARS